MTAGRICAALVLAGAAARAEDGPAAARASPPQPVAVAAASAPAAPAPAAASAPAAPRDPRPELASNELPALADDPAVRRAMRGTPASLPPVTTQMFRIGGRTEAQPMFQFSIGDPFYRSLLLGVRIEHHLDERWSLATHALGGASLLSAPIDVCTDSSCSSPEAGRLRSTPGDIRLMTGVEVSWAPIYGKLSFAGEKTIHFDAYVSAGPELLLERIAPDAVSGTASRWALGGRLAIGERVFFSNNFLVRVGASEVLYSTRVRGHAEWERKLSLELGAAWLFGGR
jgi:outer membrane beta-barrel protein